MTNYEVLVEQEENWPREISGAAYEKSMYKAMDDLTDALRRLFEPVIYEVEKVVEKAARYLDD